IAYLRDEHVGKAIDDQARQFVAFAVDDAPGVGVVDATGAALSRSLEARAKKSLVNRLLVAAEHAQGNVAVGVVEGLCYEVRVRVQHAHQLAILRRGAGRLQFVATHPRIKVADALCDTRFQHDSLHKHVTQSTTSDYL